MKRNRGKDKNCRWEDQSYRGKNYRWKSKNHWWAAEREQYVKAAAGKSEDYVEIFLEEFEKQAS